MKPGIVYHASPETIAKENRYSRGEAECFDLLVRGDYAEAITATEIHLTGSSESVTAVSHDVLIFVREGEGKLIIDGEFGRHEKVIDASSAALVTSGASYTWKDAESLKALEILIPDSSTPFARKSTVTRKNYTPFVKQGHSLKSNATGAREFEVLFNEENGSSGATMFIGFIPPSGAPSHYHLYDEVCHIVRGGGQFKVGDLCQPIGPGSTFVVAPRLLHSIINDREEDLWILGTFRPSGSPAAAYYPDGTPAPGYIESE
jgi:mannose-6-phosphate isomerase-like protein (cupin superfamily)